MKIAILLFGHLRQFETCADSLREHVLNHYDCDVFMHTWDERDVKTKTWHQQVCEPSFIDKDAIGKIIEEKYSPKAYEITHQEKREHEELVQSAFRADYQFSTAGMYFLMYSMNRANQLRHKFEKENDVHYDYVMVARPDIRFLAFFDINKVINQALCFGLDLNRTRFYAPHPIDSHYTQATLLDCASDIIFFGLPNVIDTFINVNQNIDVEYAKTHSLGVNSIFVCREIENGIMPIPIGYMRDVDWNFCTPRINKIVSSDRNKRPLVQRIIKKILKVLLLPFSFILFKFPGLNSYR